MTEKLYYEDPYVREFSATVISSVCCDGGYDTVLDRTAFFPEEGGQSSDTGFISDSRVSYVYETDGTVHHITDSKLSGTVDCRLDFDSRFDKMQCHTAEHILCGIIHSIFGLDNVGFHLGDDEVTFDISAPLERSDLDKVESLANEAVFRNIPIRAYFPNSDELSGIEYRSKLDITEGVRLVEIGDVDTCACCAPHVSSTGEIGLIKILEAMKHRGGMRIWMVAGSRALTDYNEKYRNIREISAALSAPQHDTASALSSYMQDAEQIKYQLKLARRQLAEVKAETVPATDGNAVYYLEGFSIEDLRFFANAATSKVGGILVSLCGSEGDYKYVITSKSVNLSAEIKAANSALGGRGGGKPNAVQGSFSASLKEIREYFSA